MSLMSIVGDFKAFILRGNVLDLAVGVAIGAGFGKVVNAIVADIITPIAGIPGKVDLSYLTIHTRHATFALGDLLNSIVEFFILALVIFLSVVKPVNYLMEHARKPDPTTRACPECLTQIPLAAKRCPACTSVLEANLTDAA
jgi:large conductance mechanosensitive channel